MNVRERREFELTCFDVTAKHFSHETTGLPLENTLVKFPLLLYLTVTLEKESL